MGAPRFFAGDAAVDGERRTAKSSFPHDVAHHALRVLRLAPGDAIVLFDGTGGEYAATITRAGKREAWARIDASTRSIASRRSPSRSCRPSPPPTRWTRSCATRSSSGWPPSSRSSPSAARGFPSGAHGDKRLAHWRQVAVAACEQCGRNRVPQVGDAVPLSQWLSSARARASCSTRRREASLASLPAATALDVLVGPEGGLTDDELAQATRAGLRAVRMGPRILRADTASLAALAAVNLLWGDFR